jgi:hypothetical protein
VTPPVRKFSLFPRWVDENLEALQGKKVLMYCTGGIRCEKGSAYLRHKGLHDVYNIPLPPRGCHLIPDVYYLQVYQLHGGIHKYIEQFPDGHFRGKNYVFDLRQAIAANDDVLATCLFCFVPYDHYTCSSQGHLPPERTTSDCQKPTPLITCVSDPPPQIVTSCCSRVNAVGKQERKASTAVRNVNGWALSGTNCSRRPSPDPAVQSGGVGEWRKSGPCHLEEENDRTTENITLTATPTPLPTTTSSPLWQMAYKASLYPSLKTSHLLTIRNTQRKLIFLRTFSWYAMISSAKYKRKHSASSPRQ